MTCGESKSDQAWQLTRDKIGQKGRSEGSNARRNESPGVVGCLPSSSSSLSLLQPSHLAPLPLRPPFEERLLQQGNLSFP